MSCKEVTLECGGKGGAMQGSGDEQARQRRNSLPEVQV